MFIVKGIMYEPNSHRRPLRFREVEQFGLWVETGLEAKLYLLSIKAS